MFAKYKHFTTEKSRKLLTATLIAVLAFIPFFNLQTADAAALNQTLVRFDRMKIGTTTTGTVCFKPTTGTASTSVAVTFPTGYTLGSQATFTSDSVSTNHGWPTGGTTIPAFGATASNVTGQVVTFTYSSISLSTSNLYCFNWTNVASVTTKATTGTNLLGSVAVSNGDTGQYTTSTINDDQIAVSASVISVFSFALGSNSDPLGQLSTGTVSVGTGPTTATISTNATNGWNIWAKDDYQGLCSPTLGTCTVGTPTTQQIVPGSVGANSTLVAGTIGYNTGIVAGAASHGLSATPDPAYLGGSTGKGGGLDTALRRIASAGGPSDTAPITITNNAAIDGTVRAASDYGDKITVVAAGLF